MINVPTIEQLNELPRLRETEHVEPEEKIVHLHFTVEQCHWWVIEWDGQDTFFGFVLLYGIDKYARFGLFQFSELQEIKVAGLFEVVNDPYWIPKPIKNIGQICETPHYQSLLRERITQRRN